MTSEASLVLAWATLIGGVIGLFAIAKGGIRDESWARVGRWLAHSAAGGESIRFKDGWLDSFSVLFDRVFGKRWWSLRWIAMSVLTSVVATVVTVMLLLVGHRDQLVDYFGGFRPTRAVMEFAVVFPFTVLLPDYISTLMVRRLVAFGSRRRTLAAQIAVFFATIFVCGMLAFAAIMMVLSTLSLDMYEDRHVLAVLWDGFVAWLRLSVLFVDPKAGDDILWLPAICTLPCLFSSLWLWAFTLAALVIRRTSAFGIAHLNLERDPAQALGLVVALMTTLGFAIAYVVMLVA